MSILFNTIEERLMLIKKAQKKYYPDFYTGGFIYRSYLKKFIQDGNIILDAGAGERGIIGEFKNDKIRIIGLDIDEHVMENNKFLDKRIICDLKKIPIKDNSIDIVTCQFVLEHLENPEEVFLEINRVLKKGGVFIFMTTNLWNPFMLLSLLTPTRIHDFVRKNALKKIDQAYPTYYQINSFEKIKKLGRKVGFSKFEIKRAGNPEYLALCKPLVIPAVLLERVLATKFFQRFQLYLIGCFVK